MAALVEKEKRIALLEKALEQACGWIETAADIIESEIDPDDIDGENKQARRQAAEWRRLLEAGK